MSYANRKQMSGNRTRSIIMVVLIQFALGYALVTGLAYNVVKKAAEDLKTFDVEEAAAAARGAAAAAQGQPKVPPPPVAPPPMVRIEAPTPPIQTVTAMPTAVPPVAPSPPPPPPPPHKVVSAQSAKGDLRSLVQRGRLSSCSAVARERGHCPGAAHDWP